MQSKRRSSLGRVRVQKHFPNPTMTKQAFKDETNINNIMARYIKDGVMDHVNTHQGNYGNFIGYENYHTSLNQILQAEAMFLTIPAKIRALFNNDPATFLAFADNPENQKTMVEIGLALPSPEDAPRKAEPAEGTPTLKEIITAATAASEAALADKKTQTDEKSDLAQ